MEDHFRRLREAGIDTEAASQRGQLVVKRWQDAYLRDGHFDQDRMLSLIEDVLSAGPKEGYPLTRLVAHMDWALEDFPGVNDLVEYETRAEFHLARSTKTRSYERMTAPSLALASQWTF